MQSLVIVIHVFACLFLIVLVLLQAGKEGMGVIFGGGSSSIFGGTGAGSLLGKLTAWMAAIFLVTSLAYNYLSGARQGGESIMQDIQIEQPAQPQATAPVPPASQDNAPAAPQAEAPKQ